MLLVSLHTFSWKLTQAKGDTPYSRQNIYRAFARPARPTNGFLLFLVEAYSYSFRYPHAARSYVLDSGTIDYYLC
jgi:hypothetical protein